MAGDNEFPLSSHISNSRDKPLQNTGRYSDFDANDADFVHDHDHDHDFISDTASTHNGNSDFTTSTFSRVKSSLSSVFTPFGTVRASNLLPNTPRGNDRLSTDRQEEDDLDLSSSAEIHRHIAYSDLSAIDWQLEYAEERARKEKIHQLPGLYGKVLWFLDISHVWIVLILTGTSVAITAAFIDIVSRWLGDIKFGHCTDAFYLTREYCCSGIDIQDECPKWETWKDSFSLHGPGSYVLDYLFYVFFTTMFASAASILVLFYAPHAMSSGIPEIKTILSGFIIRGYLGFKTLVFKAIGLVLVVSAGLWVGKEGPLVHVACCCASIAMMLFPQLYKNEAMKREVLAAAASAGISVAFGSPIGGVLFALEQLSYYYPERTMWNSFVAAMVAAVSLSFLNPFRTGNVVLFQVIYDRVWHRFELVPFAVLGVIGGLYGALFTQLNIYLAKWRRKNLFVSRRPVLEVALVALVTGLLTFPNIYTRIPAALSLSHLFQECSENAPGSLCNSEHWLSTVLVLIFSSITGFFLTAYTFGTSVPAGLIMPSMINGAFMGRAVGILMQTWHQKYPEFILFEACSVDGVCVTPGVYALVGAASALCGITHLTVSTVVIMFELTGALNYVIPIMTGVMLSKWVSDAFNRKGIYESWIQFKEYPFLDNHDDQPIPDVSVESIMTKVEDLSVIPSTGSNIGTMLDLLSSSASKGFPIVKSNNDYTLVGYITQIELRKALEKHHNLQRTTPVSFAHTRNHTLPANLTLFSIHDTEDGNKTDLDDFEFDAGPQSSNAQNDEVNLREWAELNPMTLSWESSLQLAASMFSKLGLRFILFTHKGYLRGLLTRKDVWLLLNSLDTDMSTSANDMLSEASITTRGRLLSTLSYSLGGNEDEVRLLAGQDYDDLDSVTEEQA